MNSAKNNNLYLTLLDDYTTTDAEVSSEVENFLNGFEDLTEERRNVILEALQRKNIDTVKKLEKELLRIGPDVTKIQSQPEVPSKRAEVTPSLTKKIETKDKINSENVRMLLGEFHKHPTINMLLELEPEDQVKALKKVGIVLAGQFDVTNDILMRRLKDAIGSVLSGITPMKGARGFEISTPTGAGKNR